MKNLVKINSYNVRLCGRRGLTITIPSVWAKRHKVNPSDEVGFYQEPNSGDLILRPEQSQRDIRVESEGGGKQ